jgi:hypothetical protein
MTVETDTTPAIKAAHPAERILLVSAGRIKPVNYERGPSNGSAT